MKGKPSRKKGGTRKMKGGNRGPHTYVFYHIYCNANTLGIIRDQTMKIIFSGLYKDATKIYCFLVGKKENIDEVSSYIKTLPTKFEIKRIGENDTTYERFTLNSIKDLIHDNDKFLYMHSKGVSRMQETPKTAECITLWRNYLEYYLIALYKKCLEKLNSHDIVGVIYKDLHIGPHFSGNFWWSTGKYFRKLNTEIPIGTQYHDPEAYIFKGKPNACYLDKRYIENTFCLYSTPLYPKLYVDKKVN